MSSCVNNSDEEPTPAPSGGGITDLKAEDFNGEWVLYYEAKEVFKLNSLGEGSGNLFQDPGYTGFYIKFEDGEYLEKNPFNKETIKGIYKIVGEKKDSLRVEYKIRDKAGNITDRDTAVTKWVVYHPSNKTFAVLDRYKYHAADTYGVRDYSKYRNKNNPPSSYPNQPLLTINSSNLIGSWIQTEALIQLQAPSGGNITTSDSTQYYAGSKVTFKTDGTYEFRNPPKNGENEGVLATSGDFVTMDDVIHFKFQSYDESVGKEIDKASTFWIRTMSEKEFHTYDRMIVLKNGVLLTMTKRTTFRKE